MPDNLKMNRDNYGYAEYWKRHPMAIPIIILATTSAFLLVLIQGTLDDRKVIMAVIFCVFSFLLFLVVVAVLIWKKFVFYNATELVISEIDRYIKDIHESLADVEIGYGMAFDHLQAPPISQEVTNKILNFEMLSNLLKHLDYKFDGNDLTKKALAKYYFRNKKNRKGLEWIEKVSDKKDTEYNFIKGLLLWKLDEDSASRNCFDKSTHHNSLYYKYLTYTTANNHLLSEIEMYISEATKKTSPLFANFFAQVNLSTAYSIKALKFPKQDNVIDSEMLQLALKNVERLLSVDTSGLAYFNSACFVSMMGQYEIDLDSSRALDKTTYCNIIITYLDKACSYNSSYIKSAIIDNDLLWVRDICTQRFNELIGRHHAKTLTTVI